MLIFLWVMGCTDNSGRSAWLEEQLRRDNRIWLQRDPVQLEAKLQKMAIDPYNYMRGTLGIMLADMKRLGQQQPQTSFVRSAEAAQVLIFGDPHPENLAVCVNQTSSAEIVDLDASNYGPWILDLRRAALGLNVAIAPLSGCDCQEESMAALVRGYLDGLAEGPAFEGSILLALQDEAQEEGDEQKKLLKYTSALENGELQLSHSSIIALSMDEEQQLQALVDEFAGPPFRLLDTGRRIGMGVSSLPAIRYLILADQGNPDTSDDRLILFREVIDPPQYLRESQLQPPAFRSNAQRVIWTAEQLWQQPDALRSYSGIQNGVMSFKSMEWSSYVQDLEHDDLWDDWEEGDYSAADIIEYANAIGRVIGAAHQNSPSQSNEIGQTIILRDIKDGGGEDKLVAEITAHAMNDLQQNQRDYEIFTSLLDVNGPLLGWELTRGTEW